MNTIQLILLLMSAAILLVGLAQKLQIPYPIALILGGCAISLVPGIAPIYFDPNLLLLVVLPPILYYAAFWISHKEFKKNARDIISLSLGLVLATTLIIGVIFKSFFPDLPWALAFAFGAIVSPPDVVAATTILKKFALGSRLLNILEGESLINDASGLVLYKLAVIALLTGTFSMMDASTQFLKIAIGGVLVGVVAGYPIQYFSRKFLDPIVGSIFSFVIPYLVYILADHLQVSGVLAVVMAGLIGTRAVFRHHSSLRRVLGFIAWDFFMILLNCFVFVLMGSQLRAITENMSFKQLVTYTGYACVVTLAIFLIRLGWVYLNAALNYWIFNSQKKTTSRFHREAALIGWCGMRGIVSLTAALALPYDLPDGSPVPGREVVIFITFIVILLTLLIPGLTLPRLISLLKIKQSTSFAATASLRQQLSQAAEEEINRLFALGHLNKEEQQFLKNYFKARLRILEISSPLEKDTHILEQARIQALSKQRQLLMKLWEAGEVDDKVMSQLERELDVEETHWARAEIK